jgi:glutamate/tyrosine decarboxylase-like PLP-dependent enzyme
MRKLLESTAQRAVSYLEGLDQRSVAPASEAIDELAQFYEPLPDDPTDPEEVLRKLDEIGSPATIATGGSRFFGFVIGGALPASIAANWLATAWDQNSGLYNITPVTATLEDVALGWMIDLLGLPKGTGAGFVTGATVANFTALAAARHAVLERVGWDVEANGLFGAPPITILISEEAHPTLFKSLGLLGLGRNRVERIPVDGQGRMLIDALPAISGPTIVCTQAGNINTGAFDPIGQICERASHSGAWVHVDGAFGLWAAASPEFADLTAGMEMGDSWATDAHKTLNVPYDSGLAFVRDSESLRAAMAITAEYLPTSEVHRQPSDYTPELSRRGRGVDVWAALRQLGRSGVGQLVEGLHHRAGQFASGLSAAGIDVLNEVVFNQVLVSFGDSERTLKIIAAIQDEGTTWCGGTQWQGMTAMRISVSSWATTEADVAKSLEAIVRMAEKF